MKRCTKCRRWKPFVAYSRDRQRYDGLCPSCRACGRKAWRLLKARHPEQIRAANRMASARYRQRYPRRRLESQRRYRRRYATRLRVESRLRARRRYRRARKAQAIGWYGIHDVARIYATQRAQCFYCWRQLHGRFHVDHKIPLARGGTNWPDNICCACSSCNLRKHAKTAAEFAWGWRR